MAASSLERIHVARRRTLPIATACLAISVLAAFGAMYIYDDARSGVIAKGVRVAGIPVGGLSAPAARAKVQRELAARENRPVIVRAASRRWTLGAAEARVHADVPAMVSRALSVSREGSFITRAVRGIFGGSVDRNVALSASYSHAAVRALASRIRSQLETPPVNASVQPEATRLRELPSRDGIAVNYSALGARIDAALTDAGPRTVTVPARHTKPSITLAQLASKYPAYIVIDRGEFRLRFYEHLKLTRTYEIAVGMEGLETPGGLHKIEWEQVDPPWYVPKKAWAGALAGTVVPPGPADPLKARFMSFDGGAGIHGIDPSEYETIGHNASHGCVRMRIPDVIELYSKSPVGTPVYII